MPRKPIPPTDREDAEINAGLAADPDTAEWSEEQFASARPAAGVLAEIFPPEMVKEMLKPRRRHKPDAPTVRLSLRLDAAVVEEFKATGPGWQARMNSALKEWIEAHPAA